MTNSHDGRIPAQLSSESVQELHPVWQGNQKQLTSSPHGLTNQKAAQAYAQEEAQEDVEENQMAA